MSSSANELPRIATVEGVSQVNDREVVFATVNASSTFKVIGTDDGSVSYQFVNDTTDAALGDIDATGVNVTFTLTDENPKTLRYGNSYQC